MQDYFQTDTAVEKYHRVCHKLQKLFQEVSTKLGCASVQQTHLRDPLMTTIDCPFIN